MSSSQFSDASQYGIDIDWANDATIDFAIPRIQKLLNSTLILTKLKSQVGQIEFLEKC